MEEQDLQQIEDNLNKARLAWLEKQVANIWLSSYLYTLFPLPDAPYSIKPLANQIKSTLEGQG